MSKLPEFGQQLGSSNNPLAKASGLKSGVYVDKQLNFNEQNEQQ